MKRQSLATRYFAETVRYGGLLVSRIDMERHLNDCGVTGPARLGWALSPAVLASPEAVYTGTGFRILSTGQVLP